MADAHGPASASPQPLIAKRTTEPATGPSSPRAHPHSSTIPAWHFLTNHARVLVCIARDPSIRLSEIASALGTTERTAVSIVTDLTEAGYVVKEKRGRRNGYHLQRHLPLPEIVVSEQPIGEVLDALLHGHGGC